MRILGLTGDIACGKSTVAAFLKNWGAAHLDSDLLVRELYADENFAALVSARFGDVLNLENGVDRAKLGAIVFSDAQKLQTLETLVFPAVTKLRAQKFELLRENGASVVAVEAVKLLESGQGQICEEIWCVVASQTVQTKRLIQDRGLTLAQAEARLASQPSRADKMRLAQSIPLVFLENDDTLAALEMAARALWQRFTQKARAATL